MRRPALSAEDVALRSARAEHEAARRNAAALLDDPTVTVGDIRAAGRAVRDARIAERRAANAIEARHRTADRAACLEAAAILEQARDVHDWALRAAAFRAQVAEHDARLAALSDPQAAAEADDAAPRPAL